MEVEIGLIEVWPILLQPPEKSGALVVVHEPEFLLETHELGRNLDRNHFFFHIFNPQNVRLRPAWNGSFKISRMTLGA